MTRFLIPVFFLLTMVGISSCASIHPAKPEFKSPSPLLVLPRTGSVNIPVHVKMNTLSKMLEENVQKNFYGGVEKCQGFSYNYSFQRNPFQLSATKKGLDITLPGAYGAELSFCARCKEYRNKGPRCISGKLDLSCGIDEAKRKIEVDFNTRLLITSKYQLVSQTNVERVRAIDPCDISFLKLDASRLIEKHLLNELEIAAESFDDKVANTNIKNDILKGWAAINQVIPLSGYGFLYLQPSSVAMDQLQFDQSGLSTNIQFKLSPVVEKERVKKLPQPLPNLQEVELNQGIDLPLLSKISYEEINSRINREMAGKTIRFRNRKITMNRLNIIGSDGQKAIFKLDFQGRRSGEIFLTGTPTYNDVAKEITFPDLTYELKTKSVLMKTAKWLFSKKFNDYLKRQAVIEIGNELAAMKSIVNKSINRKFKVRGVGEIELIGEMYEIKLSEFAVYQDHIEMLAHLKGTIRVEL